MKSQPDTTRWAKALPLVLLGIRTAGCHVHSRQTRVWYHSPTPWGVLHTEPDKHTVPSC